MARPGILFPNVAHAAAALAAAGTHPTVDAVRAALGGTGSKSTIAPMLKRWKAENREFVQEADSGLPAELLQVVKHLHEKLQADVQLTLIQEQTLHQEKLQAATEQMQRAEAAHQTLAESHSATCHAYSATQQALETLTGEHHAMHSTLAATHAENLGLQRRLTDRAAEIAALNAQLTQTRAQFDHYQEATATQRAEERQTSEQRTLRLEQQLAESQQRLASQQSQLGQQEARLGHLTTENRQLQETGTLAQEQLRIVRAEREQLGYQVAVQTTSHAALNDQLHTVQNALTETRIALGARQTEVSLLAARLEQSDMAMEKRDVERLAWMQTQAELNHQIDTLQREKAERKTVPT